jgi:hypothetical protein
MKLRWALSTLGAVGVGLFALPALASAAPPVHLKGPTQTIAVAKPSDVAFDPFSGDLYVTSRGDPPSLLVYRRVCPASRSSQRDAATASGECANAPTVTGETGLFTLLSGDVLPPGTVARALEFGTDGYVWVLDDGNDLLYKFRPAILQIVGTFPLPADRANGLAFGYRTDALETAGNADTGEPGSAFFGQVPSLPLGLSFGDTRFPNGVDLLPGIGGLRNGRVPSAFLFYDAQNNDVLEVSDTAGVPGIVDASPGPPDASGATPGTDLDVTPFDVDPQKNGAGADPYLIPAPGQGQIYEATEPGKPYQPLLQTPTGRPVRVDTSCDPNQIAWADFTNDQVSVSKVDDPKRAQCDNFFDLIAFSAVAGFRALSDNQYAYAVFSFPLAGDTGLTKTQLRLKVLEFVQTHRVRRMASQGHATAMLARGVAASGGKVRGKAGRVKKVKLRFSRRESQAIRATLRRRHRINGSLRVQVKSGAGERATVKRRIRIKLH